MAFVCIICTEDFTSSESEGDKTPMCIKSCGHVFHNSCLSLWLEKSGTCPICREPTLNRLSHVTKLHFQRLSMDNSSLLGLLDETDKLRDEIKSKDALLAAQNIQMKQTHADLLKVSKDLKLITARFQVSNQPVEGSSASSSSSSSTSNQSNSVDPGGSRVRIVSTRAITGRAPLSVKAILAERRARTLALASTTTTTTTVAPRISSRGRSTSSGTLRRP